MESIQINFCCSCGAKTEKCIPVGDNKLRTACTVCGYIHYQNPKMVVGCILEHEKKILLCRRAIEPSYGLWTIPAGYMELGESAAEGAARETLEEANADVQVLSPFAHLDIPTIGLSYIIFHARFRKLQYSPGDESLECALFGIDEIPFDTLAFSSVRVALEMYVEDMAAGCPKVHHAVLDKRPGAIPSDATGYKLRDHIQFPCK